MPFIASGGGRQFLRRHISPGLMGELDYWLRRRPANQFGGPFNGQQGRTALVEGLINSIDPVLVLETGTYRGTTTEWFAKQHRPVISIEGNPRNHAFAKARLRKLKGITLLLGDSRDVLNSLSSTSCDFRGERPILAYLDAHWNADLPLESEIRIIFSTNRRSVILIDDFEVITDAGYTFDDYGPGARIDLNYISRVVSEHDLAVFFPTLDARKETGFRRGCAILCKRNEWEKVFMSNQGLCRAPQ